MSGGIAYIFDEKGNFAQNCNKEMVSLQKLTNSDEICEVRHLIENHSKNTNSLLAQRVLANWDAALPKFVRVIPKDYERVLQAFDEVQASGLSGDEAVMAAFELNKNDRTRVSGN
jgi:glutamate synthase (ferredoxin)